jgi:hypothetical protein
MSMHDGRSKRDRAIVVKASAITHLGNGLTASLG